VNVYLFSGLGADERLFQKLEAPKGVRFVPLAYIPPTDCNTLSDYAATLKSHYHFEKPYALGGVSMGGMVAQELAQYTEPEKLILISTATSRADMPGLFSLARALPVDRLLNKHFLTAFAKTVDPFTIKSEEGRKLFLDMLNDSSTDFLRFGAKAILDWKPQPLSVPVVRIHGTRDRVFPSRKVKDAIVIEGGNHFMVFEKAAEISEIIAQELS
jgi:pimeloyl-ACP methyl ester carboxylesterase